MRIHLHTSPGLRAGLRQGVPAIPLVQATPVVSGYTVPPANNARGIALMLLGMFLFAAADTMAKVLVQAYHPVQIVWVRQLGLVSAVIVLVFIHGRALFATSHPGLQIGRGLVAIMSATLFIFAIRFVPLADAVAVSFIAPFMVTVLGALVLREPVGIRRWSAVVLGFIGTLIVIRPGAGVLHPAVMLIVVAASFFAIRQVISRKLAPSDRTATTVAYTALTSAGLLSIPLGFVWQWPQNPAETALFAGVAILAGCGEFLVIKSLQMAEAVAVAPMHYSLMIWGTFYGFMVFNELPDIWTWVGSAIIIATGIYTLNRERIAARERRTAAGSA